MNVSAVSFEEKEGLIVCKTATNRLFYIKDGRGWHNKKCTVPLRMHIVKYPEGNFLTEKL